MLLAAETTGLVSMLKRTVACLVFFVVMVRPTGSVTASAWIARLPQELRPADLASCYSTPFLDLPVSRSDARLLLSSFDLDIFSGWWYSTVTRPLACVIAGAARACRLKTYRRDSGSGS